MDAINQLKVSQSREGFWFLKVDCLALKVVQNGMFLSLHRVIPSGPLDPRRKNEPSLPTFIPFSQQSFPATCLGGLCSQVIWRLVPKELR